MAFRIPESTDECLYFTNRTLEGGGKAMAWTYKKLCPRCRKAKMGKPVEKGKVKIRAKEYTCPACGFTEEKVAHENSLMLECVYTCPSCKKKGESSAPYIRKKVDGIPSYVVECQHCKAKIALTKKMKSRGEPDDDE